MNTLSTLAKRRFAVLAVAASALALVFATGCLPSLNPLYSEKDIIFDPTLIGSWTESSESSDLWTFAKADDKTYRLVITEKGEASPFIAHLLKLNDQRFLDLQPEKEWLESAKAGGIYKSLLVRGHLIVRVDQTTPRLRLASLHADWLGKLLKADPTALAHVWVEEDQLVLTAATKELQSFVLQHLDTPGAWGDPTDLRRVTPAGVAKP